MIEKDAWDKVLVITGGHPASAAMLVVADEIETLAHILNEHLQFMEIIAGQLRTLDRIVNSLKKG